MRDGSTRYRAPALDKGLDILELLAAQEMGLTQAEIAKALGRSPSELYRMIDRLVRRGYVRRSARDDRLMLGAKLFVLATRHPPMRRLLRMAGDVTMEVAARSLQSCHLALYRDGQLFVAVQTDSPGRLGLGVRLGAAVDLLETGSGQAMLAFQSRARRQRMLAEHAARLGTAPAGEETVDDLVRRVRRRGYVRKRSAQARGVVDLACPILGGTGDAVAALAIPYIARLEPAAAPDAAACLAILREAAAELSTALPEAAADDLDDLEEPRA